MHSRESIKNRHRHKYGEGQCGKGRTPLYQRNGGPVAVRRKENALIAWIASHTYVDNEEVVGIEQEA
eukprot:27500-Eustigmatos_ZCMA.PRE.1